MRYGCYFLKNLDYGVDYESIRIKLWLTNCDSYLFYNIKQPAQHYTESITIS